MCGGLFVAHVLKVAVHHGDGVDVSTAANVSNGEIFGDVNTHVDDVGVGLVGAVGIGSGVVLELTVVLDDGDVVIVTGVGDLAGGVVEALTSQQEDVVVGTGAAQRGLRFAVIANLDDSVGVGLRRTQRCWYAVGGGGDGASVGDNPLRRDVGQQVENVDVVVAVLIGVPDGHVPHPEVSVPLTNGPVSVVTTAVFDDGNVARFTCGCALIVGLERVVFLVNNDVNGVVAGEFAHFHLLNVGEFVPVRIPALVASDPDVLAVVEVTKAVVVENRQRVRAVRGDRHVVVPVTVKVTDSDIHRISMRRVGAGD